MSDPVNHPAHYTTGRIEVSDFIADKDLNFFRGNAVKYVVRAGLKDPEKEIEDLEKAVWYINREIKRIKEDEMDRSSSDPKLQYPCSLCDKVFLTKEQLTAHGIELHYND